MSYCADCPRLVDRTVGRSVCCQDEAARERPDIVKLPDPRRFAEFRAPAPAPLNRAERRRQAALQRKGLL